MKNTKMMRTKHIGYGVLAMLMMALLPGCESWLDVHPKSSLKKEELFKNEQGYLDVLHGVYIGLLGDGLYGQELTYGTLDVLAQYYDNIATTPAHKYNATAKYDYTNATVKARIDNIWYAMYNNIANCNVILDNIEADKAKFTGNNYNRVKGEALALRAFMHFDLLRLYAPAYTAATKSGQGIPYVDRFTNVRIPFSSMEAVCGRIRQDFLTARELLKQFDLMGPVDETVDGSLSYTVADRKGWMSYYAITALLARLELYTGQKTKAMEYVAECTSEHAKTKIYWAQSTQFYYYFFSRERIFGLSIVMDYMNTKVSDYFDPESALANNILRVSITRTMELYETSFGGASDYRYLNWMSRTDDNYLLKYNNVGGIQVIKIAELYLIAAECTKDTDPAASRGYLDEIRTNRGLTALPQTADLAAEIQKEYVKEFLGEGQLFHYFKRLNYNYIPYWSSPVGDTQYIFPLPDKEIEFNS